VFIAHSESDPDKPRDKAFPVFNAAITATSPRWPTFVIGLTPTTRTILNCSKTGPLDEWHEMG
jgi:hypothetical protein